MKKWYWSSVFWLIIALISGVFAREFTKTMSFEGQTSLFTIHSHLLVLGFCFSLLVVLFMKSFSLQLSTLFYWLYQISLLGLTLTLFTRGIFTVTGQEFSGLNHIAGLFHALIALTFGLFLWYLSKIIDQNK